MFKKSFKNWQDIPFHELTEEYIANKDNWSKYVSSREDSNWFNKYSENLRHHIPHILSYMAENFELPKNEENKIDIKKFITTNFKSLGSVYGRGFYIYLTQSSRTKAYPVAKGLRQVHSPYNAFVPIIPYAFKCYKNVPYETWRSEHLELIVDEKLYCLMQPEFSIEPSEDYWYSRYGIPRDKILEIRENIIETKKKSPESIYAPALHLEFKKNNFKSLEQMASLQIWAAMPKFWTDYMVLDPLDWDAKPPKLIEDTEIFITEAKEPSTRQSLIDELWS